MTSRRRRFNGPAEWTARVTAVETAVAHLSRSLDDFVRTTKENYQSLRAEIRKLSGYVSKQQRVNWPLVVSVFFGLFAVVGTAAGIVALIGSLAMRPIQQHQQFMQQALLEQRDRVKTLDVALRREMRLLNSVQDTRVERLDARLQQEMLQIKHLQDANLAHVKELLVNLDEKLKTHMQQADHPLGVIAQIEELKGSIRTLQARLEHLTAKKE